MINYLTINYLTITEAQQQLPDLSHNLKEPAIITQDGKPVIVALSMDQFASLVETMEILSDQEFMSELREGIRQADLGQTISLESLKLNLGF
jgi:antitoxin YefM